VNLIQIPFTEKWFEKTVFVIAVDLSKPGSALYHLQFWLNIIREAQTQLY